MKKIELPLNLQFFADNEPAGGDTDDKPGDGSASSEQEQHESKPVTFASQSEFDSIVDKRIAKALETARGKWQTETQAKIQKEREEAERLAKLSKDERKEAEFKKREEELKAKEAELNHREFIAETAKQLAEKKIPEEFAELVAVESDADKTHQNIATLENYLNKEVQRRVDEKLGQSADHPSGGEISSTKANPWNPKTRNLTEQGRILQQDPALAERLMRQAGYKR